LGQTEYLLASFVDKFSDHFLKAEVYKMVTVYSPNFPGVVIPDYYTLVDT